MGRHKQARETPDDMAERISALVIEQIELETLDAKMPRSDAAAICRSVAAELRQRANLFDDEGDD